MSAAVTIRIQEADFDTVREIARLADGRTDVGALVSFSGLCRGEERGAPITALTLEHYPGMAEAEIGRHADEALARWPLRGLTIVHRVGRITPGQNIVLVVTASSHRQAAFEAAEFLMDYLKTSAPFWKRVENAAGTNWVDARADDDAAAARWTKS
ncbi:MAG: molybdenum cofactor biosynthesis protein MoaE [Bradyrhizobium sp.]